MQNYHNLLQKILDEGILQDNRTGIPAYSIVGEMLSFDMNDGFPAITTKKLAFNQVKGELLGFIRGYTNAADFRKLGCTIWDQNANENTTWLNNSARKGTDDLGCIYGKMWRAWPQRKLIDNPEYTGDNPNWPSQFQVRKKVWDETPIDQLANALNDVVQNPTSRRIKVEAWNPAQIGNMALPPCHTGFQLYVNTRDNELSLTMNQRSCDMFLGIPFNIASYALLLHIIAEATGYKARHLKMFLTDCHIYENHVEQVKEQLTRFAYKPADLVLKAYMWDDERDQTALEYMETLEPKDIHLIGYESWPAIKGAMAV